RLRGPLNVQVVEGQPIIARGHCDYQLRGGDEMDALPDLETIPDDLATGRHGHPVQHGNSGFVPLLVVCDAARLLVTWNDVHVPGALLGREQHGRDVTGLSQRADLLQLVGVNLAIGVDILAVWSWYARTRRLEQRLRFRLVSLEIEDGDA